MPVTQTDQHNTDLTEILLALRLEDFDLAPVLEAVEDLQLDAGCADGDGFVSRGHADIAIADDFEIRVKFALWGDSGCPIDADDYLTLDVTPVFNGRIQVARALIARASESRQRLCLNGRHPQGDREYFRELVLRAATRSLHSAASV